MSFNRKKPHLRGGYYIHIAPGDPFLQLDFGIPTKKICFAFVKKWKWMHMSLGSFIERPTICQSLGWSRRGKK